MADFHCTITATLRRFSSCDEDSVCTENDNKLHFFSTLFKPTFYRNGSCDENEGHVSITFNSKFTDFIRLYSGSGTFSSTASVIDASGNKRFPQSLGCHVDIHSEEHSRFSSASFQKGLGFEKFVKRSTLLSDYSELLPDDSLTLCLEIDFVPTQNVEPTWEYDTDGLLEDNGNHYLRLDTEFAGHLIRMSSVFQDMMEVSTDESMQIAITLKDFQSFKLIYDTLSKDLFFAEIPDIRDLYLTADKLNMQQIVQLCHQLLMNVMSTINTQVILAKVEKGMRTISELGERFDKDESLRDILAIYSVIKTELEGGTRDFDASDACELESEWRCEHLAGCVFKFRKIKSDCLEMDSFK